MKMQNQDYYDNMYNDAIPDEVQLQYGGSARATSGQFLWICALILSFSYERSLVVLTAMDRLNPRLFDIVFFLGLVFVLPNLTSKRSTPAPFKAWIKIVAVFCTCAVLWAPFFPWYYAKYTIFFALKYVKGAIAMYIALQIPITQHQKKMLQYMVVAGGIVVALYAVPEYLRGGTSRGSLEFAGGEKELVFTPGSLFSCLGYNYFHVAMFSAVSSVMTLALVKTAKTFVSFYTWFFLAMFVAWPAMFCGSRAGIVAVVLSWSFFAFIAKAKVKGGIFVVVVTVLLITALTAREKFSLSYWEEKSVGLKRLISLEENKDEGLGSATQRLHVITPEFWKHYRWQGIRLPVIGGGFYVVPHTDDSGARRYRVGYGVHNSYLFAFEQGGIAALVLFIIFLIASRRGLKDVMKFGNEADSTFAGGMLAFFYALLLVMIPGQVFWHGFEKVNFNSYLVLLFVLAMATSGSPDEYPVDEFYDSDY
jgi:hypothetical protein